MKRLTLNRVAAASLRANRKSYAGLVFGIFLAVYLAATVSLCSYGIVKANEQLTVERVGYVDCVLFDEPDLSDERLRDSGLFSQIGRLYLKAAVKDTDVYLGYADEEGAALICQGVLEGRLPERAGEIALERGVLDKLRLDAKIGDTLRLTLTPVGGFDEERELTLVGILREQSENFTNSSFYSTVTVRNWPSALIASEESFRSGDAVVHRVLRYAPLVTLGRVNAFFDDDFDPTLPGKYNFFGVSRVEGQLYLSDPAELDAINTTMLISMVLVLGASLLLVTIIGISSAMESVLDTKTNEIGLLRAVGATRRQIRRIFAREPWLICLIALPGALLLATLTALMFSLIAPEQMRFAFSLWLLLPTVLVSAMSVLISSARPLLRASRQAPMGVMRDTALLRKAKRFRNHKSFSVPRLIALRQFWLHPWRQLGAALIMTLTLLILPLFPDTANYLRQMNAPAVAFTLLPAHYRDVEMVGMRFMSPAPGYDLSEQDLAQLKTIEHVRQVERYAEAQINLVLDAEIPRYLLPYYSVEDRESFSVANTETDYLLWDDGAIEPPAAAYGQPGFLEWCAYTDYRNMSAVAEAAGIDGKLLPVRLSFFDSPEAATENMEIEGELDWDALNRGDEVLLYAPEPYVYFEPLYDSIFAIALKDEKTEAMFGQAVAHAEKSCFEPGQTLALAQLVPDGQTPLDFADSAPVLSAAPQPVVTVGAVLRPTADNAWLAEPTLNVITSFEGAKALGLAVSQPLRIELRLDGDVDRETEALLEARLTAIARRGDMRVQNNLELARQTRGQIVQALALYSALLLLFFASVIAMQVTGGGRRIRADARMIGTLRAVGADEKTLLRCYRVPTLISIAFGTALALVLYGTWPESLPFPALVVPFALALAALCALCSLLGLRLRLRRVLDQSIVENVREL